jgi:hypothetical protein
MKALKREALATARAECKDERDDLASKLEQLVEAERRARAETREIVRRERVRRRQACKDRKKSARARGDAAIAATRGDLQNVRRFRELEIERIRRRRAERSAELAGKRGKKRRGRRGIEAILEHDERAERAVEGWRPDLVALWRKKKREFKGGTPEQRAERFVEAYGGTGAGEELWGELGEQAELQALEAERRYVASGGRNPAGSHTRDRKGIRHA